MTSTTSTPDTTLTTRRVPVLLRVGAVVGALLAVVDLVGTFIYWSYAPIEINIAYLVISLLTFIGAVFAWRGKAWGAWVVIVTRFLSIVMTVPVFLDSGAPAEAIAPSAVQDLVTVAVIVLLFAGLAKNRKA
ncbi:hypothetical protein BH11ACT3_BH11ACT3_17940 [soil metagenome]